MTPSQHHTIMAFKLNNANNYEPLGIENMVKGGAIRLRNYPIVFKAKCEELVEEGLAKDMDEATKMAWDMEVELELYYEKGTGLFAVESGAVESGTIYSPYTAELGEDADDEE